MPTGRVKSFDSKRGYGFIIGEQGQDIFVHFTSIIGTEFRVLKGGEVVTYDLVKGEKGFQARNVARAQQDAAPPAPAPAEQPEQPPANSAATPTAAATAAKPRRATAQQPRNRPYPVGRSRCKTS